MLLFNYCRVTGDAEVLEAFAEGMLIVLELLLLRELELFISVFHDIMAVEAHSIE